MVIGFDGSRIFLKNRTGTENYSYQLLKALAKTSAENIYMVYVRSDASINRNEWPSNFKFITINRSYLWTQLGLVWRTLIDPIDLLFVPAHTLPLIRKPGLKTVMTVHDLGAEYLPSMHQVKQRLYLNFITKFQLKGATKLIAVSEATKDDLIKKAYIDPKKIEVIYEGVDREVFKPVKGLSRAKSRGDILVDSLIHYNLQPKTYFLFVGTIQPRKNLKRLIEAFSLFLQSLVSALQSNSPPSTSSGPARSASRTSELVRFGTSRLAQTETGLRSDFAPSLVLVGSKGWSSDEIYQLPKKLGIEDRVKFLGHVSDKDLPALYSGALALVFPSLFEGFGLPILEAFSCGCPVITSDASSMPEVAGQAAILVDPASPEEIAEAMKNLATDLSRAKSSDDILRDRLIKKGYEQVNKFSWEKCALETLKVFQDLKTQNSNRKSTSKVDILGVKIDQINISQSIEKIEQWLASQGETLQSRYIVTPNIEIIMLAQKDQEFRKILNNADLAIPDSARFGWALAQLNEKNLILKLIKWPLFLLPQLFHFDTVTGTDLMESLIKLSADQAFRVGLLGGRDKVAERLKRVLKEKYPKIKVSFADSGGEVNDKGQMYLARGPVGLYPQSMSSPDIHRDAGTHWGPPAPATPRNLILSIPPTDILFVAFGHLKQEKWISKNLKKYPVKVMMGVGGAFDYLSGEVPRAPGWVQNLGFEWVFRLIVQPWRIKRFWSLIKFISF